MSIESLKQQARRHEQKEEWQKALDQYNKALTELAREDQVDIGLYNRVGDLYVRLGMLEQAVDHYEKAVDLYREAYLPNNAIAVCKKIIRNVPTRHEAYLRIGQIRAEQGFLPDARTNFLTYAERMQQIGQLDESFRALIEFCDLAPDDVGVRVTVAEQMAGNGRNEEAVEQFLIARQQFIRNNDQGQADALEEKILAIDPEADLSVVPVMPELASGTLSDDDMIADFDEISFGDDSRYEPPEVPGDLMAAAEDFVSLGPPTSDPSPEAAVDVGGFEIAGEAELAEESAAAGGEPGATVFEEEADGEAVELPIMGFDEEGAEYEAVELPIMGFEEEAAEDEAPELATMESAEGPDEWVSPGEATVHVENAIEDAASDLSMRPVPIPEPPPTAEEVDLGLAAPEPVEVPGDLPELAEVHEAPELAEVRPVPDEAEALPPHGAPVADAGEASGPEPASASPPETDRDSGDEGYVDFAAMVLGEGESKTTRFTVQYEEPSGDEEADFARMLSQFKDKVSENLDSSDVRAHYDLGTAYKEMGLLDEAIGAFQAALRASADHLPTYELMGQTFIEMGRPEAAVKSLRRALDSTSGVEDDLVGIYYYLGRAYEELENREAAVEFYDRVFSLDINFADVTERLRALR